MTFAFEYLFLNVALFLRMPNILAATNITGTQERYEEEQKLAGQHFQEKRIFLNNFGTSVSVAVLEVE